MSVAFIPLFIIFRQSCIAHTGLTLKLSPPPEWWSDRCNLVGFVLCQGWNPRLSACSASPLPPEPQALLLFCRLWVFLSQPWVLLLNSGQKPGNQEPHANEAFLGLCSCMIDTSLELSSWLLRMPGANLYRQEGIAQACRSLRTACLYFSLGHCWSCPWHDSLGVCIVLICV